MTWIFGIFGMVVFGYAVTKGNSFADGMRPYAAVIGSVLMVVAMVLTARETHADNSLLRRRIK